MKLVSSGDYFSALRVACTHLGPLATNDPSLLKQLKETLLALLLPKEDILGKGFPINALANSLQVWSNLLIMKPSISDLTFGGWDIGLKIV